MKTLLAWTLLLASFLTFGQRSNWTSYDLYLGDTVNVIENNSTKQGRWVLLGKDKKGKKYRFYKNSQIVEDGEYINNSKEGLWKVYHSSGRLQSTIYYKDNEPNGRAQFFREDGSIVASGTMKGNDFIGDYFIYDEKGKKFVKHSSKRNEYAYLEFKGSISNSKFGGDKLSDVKIRVEREGYEIFNTRNNSDGSFALKLELNFSYIIYFEKEGFDEHSLIVDGNVYNIEDTAIYKLDKWKIQLSNNLANSLSSDLVGLLLNKPAGKIYFHKRRKKFKSDGAYINLFNKQVKGISESTKFLLAQTTDDNKRLEIENLRMEAEKKMNEINLLKKAQELKEAEIKKKEAELLAQKLAKEKQDKDLAMAQQEKKIKELELIKKQNELERKHLEAEKNAKEFERLAILRKIQDYELKEKQSALSKSHKDLAEATAMNQQTEIELQMANKAKELQKQELKQQMFYVYILVGGVLMLLLFAIFIFRSFQQKKKANILLEKQSQEIAAQKSEIELKSREIEQKNIETEQSIHYARRIQHAILPPENEIKKYLDEFFILYKSKDIVSGDFYFFSDKRSSENRVYIASVDCTGHGVPGAFMSMIGYEKLKDAVDIAHAPGRILSELNKGVKEALRQSEDANSTRDGMDLSICAIPVKRKGEKTTIHYAGANRPLWIIRNESNKVEEIKATKVAIGGLTKDEQEFDEHEVLLEKGDTIYLFSDGYADQFGGPKKKKLMTGKFKDILLSIQGKNLSEQKEYLKSFMEEWTAGVEQVDDILVIGIKF